MIDFTGEDDQGRKYKIQENPPAFFKMNNGLYAVEFSAESPLDSQGLKACPFCGGKAKLDDCRTIWRIECKDCNGLILGERAAEPEDQKHCDAIDWDYFKQTAIDAWNNRI